MDDPLKEKDRVAGISSDHIHSDEMVGLNKAFLGGMGVPKRPKIRFPRKKRGPGRPGKQAVRDYRKLERYRQYTRAMGRYIRERMNEPSFARRIFAVNGEVEEVPRPKTARERRWRKYHKTEPYPWAT